MSPSSLNMAPTLRIDNRRLALLCALVVALMVGAAYASVPLYNLFCRVTGFGGTTAVAQSVTGTVLDRQMTVRFDANVARGLPWKFEPVQGAQTLKIGETAHAVFRAENLSNRPLVGSATYNVTPQKSGAYFAKLQCFCFTEQVLAPGETVEMPVTYFIDPAIADESNLDDVETITLSYTFFETENPSEEALKVLSELSLK